MAMRRPRIKPAANIQLISKRKAKTPNDVKTINGVVSLAKSGLEVDTQVNVLTTQDDTKSLTNALEVGLGISISATLNGNILNNDTIANDNNYKDANDIHELDDDTGDINNIEKNNDVKNLTKDIDGFIENREMNPKNICEDVIDTLSDLDAFKCPSNIGFQRAIIHTSNSGIDDVFYSDIEENANHMDLEKSPTNSSSMSPKNLTRQRIRPTPHFGQRRNSFVGSSSINTSVNEDNQLNSNNIVNDILQTTQTKRERHHSASSHHHYHHTPHKYLPSGVINSCMGRIRTESGCSVFSDTNTSSHKSRKIEDHKQNSRKDFEARFHNGVPEKSIIKMSDLIYYNPATNPMEQKPNPNVKLEQTDIPSSDVKPFTEKLENDTDTLTDCEAVPVPQLKLNAKGELILDDKSLVIETTAEQEARKVLANSSLIYLDENTGMNGFYSRQKRTRDWVPSETIKFYRCLQNVGTDFSLMVSLFPNRTRRDLKLKFKKEERKNCHLINKALLYPKQFDIESLKQQIDEEEKIRDEQAKKTKSTKKSKEFKKKKISNTSIAHRVLKHGDVYQNENEQRPKKVRKTNVYKDKSDYIYLNKNETVSTAAEESEEVSNIIEQKLKLTKARNCSKNLNEEETDAINNSINNEKGIINANESDETDKRRQGRSSKKVQKEEIIIIKEEIIKIENRQESNQTPNQTEYQDNKELQTEIDELLDSDEVDIQNGCSSYNTSTSNIFPVSSHLQYNEHRSSPGPVSQTTHFQEQCTPSDADNNEYEHRTFVNLDDGSVNVYSNIKNDINYITPPTSTLSSPSNRSLSPLPTSPLLRCPIEIENISIESTIPELDTNNDTCSSVISEHGLNEDDIQSILTELAEGSLVLVSTLDPDDPDKVLNEIYMVDKNTGDLCEEPLRIPDNIVQCILAVVS